MPTLPTPDHHRLRWFLGFASVLVLISGIATSALAQRPASNRIPDRIGPITVNASPITAFERTNPGRRRFGRLEFLGGLTLTSPSTAFGGWSGIAIDADGKRILAISDEGAWLTAQIVYDGSRPKAIANATIGPILALQGRTLTRKRDLDAESVTLLNGTLSRGTVLISFERLKRIGRFPISGNRLGAPLGYLKLPAEARLMKPNKGLEAVTVLQGGRLKGSVIAFAEELYDNKRNHTGWIWPGGADGTPQTLHLVNKANYAVTDLAALPDGSMIVLERFFRWSEGVRMRLRLIPASTIRPGALLDGETLIDADLTYAIDNMEGLTVHRNARGQTILTLISDDNFNPLLQRTILLQFALADNARRAQGSR